jgi:hypothetical protein
MHIWTFRANRSLWCSITVAQCKWNTFHSSSLSWFEL